jgi:hypothetical protein
MINKDLLSKFSHFYSNIKKNFDKIYKNSNFYDKKISKVFENDFQYKPSPFLLSSIINYQKKKI